MEENDDVAYPVSLSTQPGCLSFSFFSSVTHTGLLALTSRQDTVLAYTRSRILSC